MKTGVTVTVDNVQAVSASIQRLAENRVLVGIPSEKNARTKDYGDIPITNAVLGYVHEYGMPEQNIPARPFLNPGVKSSREKWLPFLTAAGQAALDGNEDGMSRNFHAAGMTAQNAVRTTIVAGEDFAPLAPATLAARRRKGRTGTKPLIETNQLLKSISYIVKGSR